PDLFRQSSMPARTASCATLDRLIQSQIHRLHMRVRANRRRSPFGDDRAPIENDHAIGEREHHVHVVLGEQHREPRLAREIGGRPSMRSPARRTVPASKASWPLIRLKHVVFPAPFGPMSATSSPAATANDTSRTACTPPNAFARPTASSTATLMLRSRCAAGA